MSNYRILEVEGFEQSADGNYYIPKYIVQEIEFVSDGTGLRDTSFFQYTKLKEFNNLEEARKYKRKLELKNGGIIIDD